MSVEGIGPSTSVLSGQRSTTELHAQTILLQGTLVHYQQLHTREKTISKITLTRKQKTA